MSESMSELAKRRRKKREKNDIYVDGSVMRRFLAFEPVKFALKRLYNSKLPVYGILS